MQLSRRSRVEAVTMPALRPGHPTDPVEGLVGEAEADTAIGDDWPVDPAFIPDPVDPPRRPPDERHVVHASAPPRSSSRFLQGMLAGLAVVLILALGAGFLWSLSRPQPTAEGSSPEHALPGQRTGIPRVVGWDLARARRVLKARGLSAAVTRTPSDSRPGTVLAQSPGPGADIDAGTHVVLVVAAAHAALRLPDLEGLDVNQALRLLSKLGVKPRVRRAESSRPAGVVLGHVPRASNVRLAKGQVVTLVISAGRVTVPSVTGLSVSSATAKLRQVGLRVEVSERASTSAAAGTVLGQNPRAGTHSSRGDTTRLEVAKRPAAEPSAPSNKVTMPTVVGLTLAEARTRLRERDLTASIELVASGTREAGTVLAQTPVTGAQLRRGMTVTIRVAGPPAKIEVPDVTGADESSARQQLAAAGFRVAAVDEAVADASQDGLVIDESPAPGTRAAKGSTVTISVGRASSG